MNPVQKKKKRTRAAKRSPNFDDSIKNTAREKLSRMCDRNPQQTSFHPLTLQVIGTCRLILANNDQQEIRNLPRHFRRIYAKGGQVHALLGNLMERQTR